MLRHARSPFRVFENYLRNVVKLDEEYLQFIFKQFNSNFVTYEIPPGVYPIKDISEAAYTKRDHRVTLRIEYDNISMKSKLILKRYG